MNETMCEKDFDGPRQIKPLSMARRKALMEVALKMASAFEELDPQEHFFLRRALEVFIRD